MAEQISANQIIAVDPVSKYVSLPRDLPQGDTPFQYRTIDVATGQTIGDSQAYGTQVNTGTAIPSTPTVLGIKEQTVRFSSDGTAVIDVTLDLANVSEAIEYDIRITKDAGNV